MKPKYVITIVLLISAGVAFAMIFNPFQSWDSLNDQSSDIIIARCTATPNFSPAGTKPKTAIMVIMDDVIKSDIEVVSVLKGNTKPGLSQMNSWCSPHQGELFLVFANYSTYQTNSWYNATEDYRIIPLGNDFSTNLIAGKQLDEQLQILFRNSIDNLNREIQKDQEEKQRLESGLKK